MRQAQVTAPAKINLYLEILGKRSDGFHELELVFQRISLADRISISESDSTEVFYSNRDYQYGEHDICWRCVDLVRQAGYALPGVNIVIEKHIPVGGGLGGASSDAAAVLRQLGEWFDVPERQLAAIALQLGSDVPFFLGASCAYARGRGEQLTPLAALPVKGCYVLTMDYGLETAAVFKSLHDAERNNKPIGIAAWQDRETALDAACFNRFTPVARRLEPRLDALFKAASEADISLHMTGSGSSCFSFDGAVVAWAEDQADLHVQWVDFI